MSAVGVGARPVTRAVAGVWRRVGKVLTWGLAALLVVAAAVAGGSAVPVVDGGVVVAPLEGVRVVGDPIRYGFTSAGEAVEGSWVVVNDAARPAAFDGMLRTEGGAGAGLASAVSVFYAGRDGRGDTWVPAGTLSDPLSIQDACAQIPSVSCPQGVDGTGRVRVRVRLALADPEVLQPERTYQVDATFYVQYAPQG